MAKKVKGKVRLAIIGSGGITGAHARGILEHADKVECVALCDTSKKMLDARDKQLGGGLPRFRDWKKMLKAMAGDIDTC